MVSTETFNKLFSDEKKTLVKVMHREIVFVKVQSSVIELSESVY